MLSDEEREAIEKIKRFNQYNWEMNNLKGKEFAKPYFESLDTLLNLIKKQSKEIERLEKKNKRYEKIIEHKDNKCEELLEFVETEKETDYVSKDKIKAKIEDILNSENSEAIEKLIEWQSLLEKE